MMTSSALYPPNSQWLSDSIVGTVVQRSKTRRQTPTTSLVNANAKPERDIETRPRGDARKDTSSTIGETIPASNHTISHSRRERAMLDSAPETAATTIDQDTGEGHVPDKKRRVSKVEAQRQILMELLDETVPTHKLSSDLLKAFDQSILHNRERRRKAQQRYRQKKEDLTTALEGDVKKLQAEIRHLQEQRQQYVLPDKVAETHPWNVVSEYYRLFRHGCKTRDSIPKAGISKLTSQAVHPQTSFLLAVMAPNVSVNSGYGIDAVLREWRSVPRVNDNVIVRLQRLEYDEKTAMVATIQVSTIITEEMLRHEFSHLVGNGEWSPHATKLLGRQLVIPATVRFEWDAVSARVTSMHYTADLVTPFLKLLGNLADAAFVISGSRLGVVSGQGLSVKAK